MRDGATTEALQAFETATNAEPTNALYQYHLALALYDLARTEAAQQALATAVNLERDEPIAGWGKRMERIQGRSRVWVERARIAAGLR
jgi:thioredoxin-like negative regulator of GroEL